MIMRRLLLDRRKEFQARTDWGLRGDTAAWRAATFHDMTELAQVRRLIETRILLHRQSG
jgi:hypothetical protein